MGSLGSQLNALGIQQHLFWGFPGGTVVKNLPTNARDTGLSPGPGRSHMPRSKKARAQHLLSLRSRAHGPQLLSPRATTTEACAPRARAPQQEKAMTMRSLRTATKSSSHSPLLEEARAQQRRPNTAKNK